MNQEPQIFSEAREEVKTGKSERSSYLLMLLNSVMVVALLMVALFVGVKFGDMNELGGYGTPMSLFLLIAIPAFYGYFLNKAVHKANNARQYLFRYGLAIVVIIVIGVGEFGLVSAQWRYERNQVREYNQFRTALTEMDSITGCERYIGSISNWNECVVQMLRSEADFQYCLDQAPRLPYRAVVTTQERQAVCYEARRDNIGIY